MCDTYTEMANIICPYQKHIQVQMVLTDARWGWGVAEDWVEREGKAVVLSNLSRYHVYWEGFLKGFLDSIL